MSLAHTMEFGGYYSATTNQYRGQFRVNGPYKLMKPLLVSQIQHSPCLTHSINQMFQPWSHWNAFVCWTNHVASTNVQKIRMKG